MHVRVEQPWEHGAVERRQWTVGGNFVSDRLNTLDDTVFDDHCGTAWHEPLTVERGGRPQSTHETIMAQLISSRLGRRQTATRFPPSPSTLASAANSLMMGVRAPRLCPRRASEGSARNNLDDMGCVERRLIA